jgi:hemerythrin-like domain-containing protein
MRRHPGLIPLSHDHQHALALCVLTERAVADAGADTVARAAAEVVQAFDAEILDHFQFEEQVLFPALEEHDALTAIVSELRSEHSRIRGLAAALKRGERLEVMEFCAALRDHVRKEETVLFERAQELLPADQLNEIGQKRTASRPAESS